jgi:putative membrane protein
MTKNFKYYLVLVLKGFGMGTANVIPGVSGGTVALITGIFEELINSIKSFDIKALKLLFTGKLKDFSIYINLNFLISVFLGIGISIFSLAKLLEYLFNYYPVFIWAYFFGLILASVYFVGKTVEKWTVPVIVSFIIGTAAALSITFLNPANENDSFIYLVICGIVAICSMILPGLSGSFVLILLGNYRLMLQAVGNMQIGILLPLIIGAGVGLVAFSHLLSWIYKRFRNETISTLTGFIFGSLAIIWPWKVSLNADGSVIPVNKYGAFVDSTNSILTDIKPFSYRQILPDSWGAIVIYGILLMLLGILTIWLMEKFANHNVENRGDK